ncbi:T9SS type A sorting domain-containing protein [Pedobacter xixiisoli]|uniref:Por secretion system C-terminal sorting domain-containing protein n=1 Tax=Pedobacter xixiisoli TaxID=1476464 RepID=A0A285ZT14_9SPHI|nr:T9SS type A sorting domain-containing protein [Pedobacter xixiisoli]SOD12804.1 Por secretion system C-terminal sorting domain-containing protein [Pedobacter xixiisoli]
MKRKLLLSCLFAVAAHTGFSQVAFTAGSLSVLRIGDGSATLGANATPVFIDEYSTSGILLRSIALPTAVVGANRKLTLSGNSSSEGLLSLSQDGKKLTLTGYDAPVGTASIAASASATYNRVVGVIDGTGNVNTSTALDIFNTQFISSAVVDGNNVWMGGGTINIYHATIGATTATSIIARTGRSMRIFNNQLYASQVSGTNGPVVSIGAGLPTTTGQTAAGLPGMPTATPSGREFFFADVDATIPGYDVLYVVNTAITDGIAKYSLVNNNWVLNGNISGQYTGLTGVVSGNEVTLYGVRFGTSANKLFKITDATGHNVAMTATATDIATAAANTVFRGLSFSPTVTTTPVKLLSFTGKEAANGVRLSWSTASEQNNSHYEIYRSTDVQNFTKIGTVKGNGTTNEVLNYSFTDLSPLSGTVYYKLRQVDFDSRFEDYGPIPVKSSLQKNDLKVQVKDNSLQVSVFASTNSTSEIKVYNISGNALAKVSANLTSGWNTVEVPFTASRGVYIVASKIGSEITKTKIAK